MRRVKRPTYHELAAGLGAALDIIDPLPAQRPFTKSQRQRTLNRLERLFWKAFIMRPDSATNESGSL